MTNPKSRRTLRKRLQQLPDPVLQSDHFLLWRHEWNERRNTMVKTPYYVNGWKRNGKIMGSKKDLRQLGSLEDALDVYEEYAGTEDAYDGIGLALVADGLVAFDLDKCLNDAGELIADHAGRYVAERAEREGAYIEISPSGRGLRILGKAETFDAYSRNKLEYWGEGRYVTLTGSVWANPRGWRDLEPLRQTLPARKQRKRSDDEEEVLVTRRVLEELRSALDSMSSDERELWVKMGHALKTIGDKGKELWMEWSAKSDKFDEQDAEYTWNSFHPESTSFRSVFLEAQDNWDWENPRSARARQQDPEEDDDEGEQEGLLEYAIDLGEPRLHPTEFVLDGFLPVGVSLVAGAWGAGKSTNLIPLFASVAHLAPEDWGFWPVLRRHVLWITEAPDQARDTIYSMMKAEGSGDWDDFKEWFHLVPSARETPGRLAKQIKKTIPSLTYTLDNGFAIRPVVVLDTVSANMDLENESDNSEVGEAMSRLKEALPGVSLVLIGHTPKALVKGDVSEMTFRGAGAWEADAVATYYLAHDPDTGMRFMTIGKVRFTPDFPEISFGQEGGRELVKTQWGDPQSKAYMHGIPCQPTGEQRKMEQNRVKDERKEAAKEREISDRQTRILEMASEYAGRPELLWRGRVREKIGGRSELVVGAIDRLLESELLQEIEMPDGVKEAAKLKRAEKVLLPMDVTPSDFFGRFCQEYGMGGVY